MVLKNYTIIIIIITTTIIWLFTWPDHKKWDGRNEKIWKGVASQAGSLKRCIENVNLETCMCVKVDADFFWHLSKGRPTKRTPFLNSIIRSKTQLSSSLQWMDSFLLDFGWLVVIIAAILDCVLKVERFW